MKWLLWFLNRPFPAHLAMRYRLRITLAFSLFVTLFMLAFEPLEGLEVSPGIRIMIMLGYGVICFSMLGIDMVTFPLIFKEHVKEGNWKVYKHLLGTLWLFTTTTCVVLLYNHFLGITEFTVSSFFIIWFKVVGTAIVPASMAILILYNYQLRLQIREAEKLQRAFDQVSWKKNGHTNEGMVQIMDVTQNDVLNLKPQQLLLIRSADNYVMCTSLI